MHKVLKYKNVNMSYTTRVFASMKPPNTCILYINMELRGKYRRTVLSFPELVIVNCQLSTMAISP